jgi:hypothetical protein
MTVIARDPAPPFSYWSTFEVNGSPPWVVARRVRDEQVP